MQELVPHAERPRLPALGFDDVDGAIGDEEIERAVVVVVDPVGAEAGAGRGRRRQAGARPRVLEVPLAVVGVEREGLADDVGDEQILVAVEIEIARCDPHAAFGIPFEVDRRARQQAIVDERAVPAIDPELVGRGVVGDVEVGPAVAVVIARRDPEPGAVGLADAGRLRGVREAAAAVVPIERRGHRLVGARAAVVARPHRVLADLVGGEREIEVMRDEEIEMAVAIVVDERGARAPQRIGEARLRRDVGERAVAAIVEERRGAEPGDEQVEEAVVVVVADGRAHAVDAQREPGTVGDVGEAKAPGAVTRDGQVVAEET